MTRTRLAALSLACTLPLATFAQQNTEEPQSAGTKHDEHGSMQMQGQMQTGAQEMQGMKMTGDPDRDFVAMMRQHHQQGSEMAQTELKDGKDATAKAFARKMIQEQQKDIKKFDQWLSKH